MALREGDRRLERVRTAIGIGCGVHFAQLTTTRLTGLGRACIVFIFRMGGKCYIISQVEAGSCSLLLCEFPTFVRPPCIHFY